MNPQPPRVEAAAVPTPRGGGLPDDLRLAVEFGEHEALRTAVGSS